MSSPDQPGSAGFTDSDSSIESTGYSHARYASHHPSGARPGYNFYTHPARTSLLDGSGALLLDSPSQNDDAAPTAVATAPAPAGQPAPGDRDHADYPDMAHLWPSSGNLPSFSRAFDIFSAADESDAVRDGTEDRFFVPTYLQSSTYVKKLEEAHKSRLQALKEARRSKASGGTTALAGNNSGTGNHAHNGADLSKPASGPTTAARPMAILRTVVERSADDDDGLAPLPTKWNKDDARVALNVHSAGLGLKYSAPRGHLEREQEASAIRADHFMPPQCGLYYYEVHIKSGNREDTTIAVGFSTKSASMTRPVGWEPESWGYHGDDGRCFSGHNIGRPYGPRFNDGDVIGCGVDFRNGTAFFTKNGVHLDTAFHDVKGKLYPSISLKKPNEEILVNFGQEPFIFNIDDMMSERRAKVLEDIEAADTSRLEPGMSETDLIQSLVLQFLQHDGYVETARAFAEDIKSQKEALNEDPEETIPGINIRDDEDANNRQRIRLAILEGDIDRALKMTDACYPQVLRDNEQVYFKLRCRKFIELVRKAALLNMDCERKARNRHPSQDMDVDQPHAWGDGAMETDGEDQTELAILESNMLEYGQQLQGQYANDSRREITKTLNEIWALVAYRNPLREPEVSYLLDPKGRSAVAEELNSAILSSLGKSSRAALEKLYAQTSVLLEDLRKDGSDGAFVSLHDIVTGLQETPPM